MYELMIIAVVLVIAALIALVVKFLRPLILALFVSYISFPVYYYIAAQEIDPLLKIVLQIAVFIMMYGLVLYVVVRYFYTYWRGVKVGVKGQA